LTVPASDSDDTAVEVAAAMNDTLAAALAGTEYAGSVSVEQNDGSLAFIAVDGSIHSLELSGGAALGFAADR
jgi:hypothetical protein